MDRRRFLKLSGLALGLVVYGGGLTQETLGIAAGMDPETLSALLKAELGVGLDQLQASDKVSLRVPEVAESGFNVPVEGSIALPVTDIKALHIFADRNPFPRIVTTSFGPLASSAYFATNVRLATTTDVRLIAETTAGAFLTTSQRVSVTVGGCS